MDLKYWLWIVISDALIKFKHNKLVYQQHF